MNSGKIVAGGRVDGTEIEGSIRGPRGPKKLPRLFQDPADQLLSFRSSELCSTAVKADIRLSDDDYPVEKEKTTPQESC